jgi:hypothetical protein
MVKIENEYGDKYTGKYSNAIYQQHYGRQIRRKAYKQNKSPSKKQIETRNRFKEAIQQVKNLSSADVQIIKKFYHILKERNPRQWPVNWYNFAKYMYIKRPKLKIINPITLEYQINYFNIYQVQEIDSIGNIIYNSGYLSDPETGKLQNQYSHTPNINTITLIISPSPGITHEYQIREKPEGLRFFDIRFFDSRYFT